MPSSSHLTSPLPHSSLPRCGPCWCIPASNGTAKCPFWKPNEEFSKQSIAAFRTQKPESIFTLDCNPYLDSTCSTTPAQTYLQIDSAVCAFLYSEKSDGNVHPYYWNRRTHHPHLIHQPNINLSLYKKWIIRKEIHCAKTTSILWWPTRQGKTRY